jgi:hypothetical protein
MGAALSTGAKARPAGRLKAAGGEFTMIYDFAQPLGGVNESVAFFAAS